MLIAALRNQYHTTLGREIIRWVRRDGQIYPNFADVSSKASVAIGKKLCDLLGISPAQQALDSQTAGRRFEQITSDFLQETFEKLKHIRPGPWEYRCSQCQLSGFVQYQHLARLAEVAERFPEIRNALGMDYFFTPDIVIARLPLTDSQINAGENKTPLVLPEDASAATLTPLRAINQKDTPRPLLHAVISCKWTIRSDRSQSVRAEAQSLIRNRKGHLPHVVAVTAEPLRSRIASLAYGTGDLDCVYHIALSELKTACELTGFEDQKELLEDLILTQRVRDISDLPFDLAA